jgi:lauroyl/myristoyl acyltransferase
MSRKKEVVRNLSLAFGPETPSPVLRTISRRFISNAVQQAADDLLLLREDTQVRCRSFRGREHLDSAFSEGRGVLLVSPHWFANRVSNRYLANLGYPVMTVRNLVHRDMFMGRLGQISLQPKYIHLLHKVIRDEVFIQDPECSLKILQRLRSGGIVEINLDASLSQHLIMRPFLGRPRQFPAGAMHLAKASGCSILPKLAVGHADSLEIQIGPPLEMDSSLPMETFCETHLFALIKIIESYVLEHADQWELWIKL